MQGMIQATPQEWMVMLSRTASQLDHAREVLRRMGNNGVGYRPTHNTRLRQYIYEIARRATVMERNIVRVKILYFVGFFLEIQFYLSLELPRLPGEQEPRRGTGCCHCRVSSGLRAQQGGECGPGCAQTAQGVTTESP